MLEDGKDENNHVYEADLILENSMVDNYPIAGPMIEEVSFFSLNYEVEVHEEKNEGQDISNHRRHVTSIEGSHHYIPSRIEDHHQGDIYEIPMEDEVIHDESWLFKLEWIYKRFLHTVKKIIGVVSRGKN